MSRKTQIKKEEVMEEVAETNLPKRRGKGAKSRVESVEAEKVDDTQDNASAGGDTENEETTSVKKSYALVVKNTTSNALQKFNKEYVEGTKLDGYISKVDSTLGFMVPRKDYQYDNPVVQEAAGPLRFGLWLFAFIFVFCMGWALLAPLDSATIASGSVVLDANRKVVDHLEGGIISEILVKDGDSVVKDQVLVRLSDTSAKARLEISLGQYLASKAAEDRLVAERDNLESVVFSEEVNKYADREDIQKILDSQRRIFSTRVDSFKSQKSIINQRINQLNEEVEGLRAQETAVTRQLALINEEIATVKALLSKGQALKPRLLSLQRAGAELLGKQGEYKALIAKAGQSIGENQLNILNLENDRLKEIVAQLRETQVQVADSRERVTAAQDIMNRIEIKAPQAGVVNSLRFHTVGGVIPPNSPVLEIVPQDDILVIDAQVRPQDIDVVQSGMKARVRLSAYSARTVPLIDGTVEYVSADRLVDQKSGMPYFIARVTINDEEIDKVAQDIKLYPGMPAEVLIVTGERTLVQYLMDPITTAMNKAFREQ